jgi:nicotinamide mononucleotide transporter
METFIHWFIVHWVENLAVVTGLLYIWLSVKQNIGCWIFGILSSILYLYVFFVSKIYADMALQLYYIAMAIYGWIHWARADANKAYTKELQVSKLNMKQALVLLGITLVLWVVMAQVLTFYTDSPIPWIDAFTTAFSITATWMLARKILEHWIIWIVVDFISVGLYFYRGLYSSIFLFIIYTLLAYLGYIEWHKAWKKQNTNILTL